MTNQPMCWHCIFWQRQGDDDAPGQCRRNPPVRVGKYAANSEWPETKPGDWCGEYRKAETNV